MVRIKGFEGLFNLEYGHPGRSHSIQGRTYMVVNRIPETPASYETWEVVEGIFIVDECEKWEGNIRVGVYRSFADAQRTQGVRGCRPSETGKNWWRWNLDTQKYLQITFEIIK